MSSPTTPSWKDAPRIGPIPQDWECSPLGKICKFSQYGINSASDKGSSYPLLRMNNLQNGSINTDDLAYANLSDEEFGRYELKRNDLLVNRTNSYDLVGKAALFDLPGRYVFASYLVRFRLDETQVCPHYVNYWFNSHIGKHLLKVLATKGVSQANINPTILKKRYLIPIPPLEEQRKIAKILGTWDVAIALTERRIEAAQQRKKGLMQRLLTGRVWFPEFVQSGEWFNTKFSKLPVDWEVMPLQKLVKPISRLETIQSDKEYRLIGVKWYTAGAHVHSILLGKDIKTASLSRIKENDIIYNKMWATKAAFAVAKPEHNGTYGTTEYPQFRARENLLWVDFLKYVFQLPRFQYDATTLCRGTTGRARLNPRDFLKLEIPLPSVKEQRRIAAVLQTCDREIELLTQKRDALQRQKKGVMQRLLTGRVRVKV